jgi:hypothetical protein
MIHGKKAWNISILVIRGYSVASVYSGSYSRFFNYYGRYF